MPERRKDGEEMGHLLRRAGVFAAAWACGTLVGYVAAFTAFPLLPLGLLFGLAAGAVVAALAASAVGRRAAAEAGSAVRGRRSFPTVLLASLGSLLLLGLPASAVLSGPGLPPIPPIPAAMAFAAAGAALAASRRRTRGPREAGPGPSGPRPRRCRFLLPLLAVAAPLVLVLGALWLPAVWACSSEERAVYEEFPQYGGRAVEPTGNPEVGSCASYYQTADSEEEVFAYFRERFEEHGWEEAPHESYREEGGELVPTDLVAHRGDFSYRVSAEEIDPEAGGHAPGTHVAAHVSHRDWGAIPPPVPPGGTAPAGGAPGRNG